MRTILKNISSLTSVIAVVAILTATPSFAIGTFIKVSPKSGGEGIQKALDNAPHGAEIVLEAGTYVVHQPVILDRDGETLRGAGSATVLYLADNANCPVVVLGSPVDKPGGPVEGLSLSDVVIDGNRKHQKTEVWRSLHQGGLYNNGIDVWNVDGVSVKGVVCCRCRSGGLVSTARTRRLVVSDYTAFDNQFDGLACYFTEDSKFSNLDLHDNLGAGISLDLNFNHNVIDGAVLTANDLGVFMRHSRNNTFQGMTIRKSRHHGVFMAQAMQGLRMCPGTECTGNIFEKLLVTNCGGDAFLVNDASCISNTICSSQFLDNVGGLSQAHTNPVTIRDLVERDVPTKISAVEPVIRPSADPATIRAVKNL
ncbi:MAG TPA: right-handed parallel beta-helix repeat-containing protein [Verrucomicrobiae bacterium]|jgi:hypothetical protein|nr:right-handed parallel beta-helix repeat-containing protein [Verrucomicrobiae bacterium]